ncbi:hypothetical protein GCM10010446_04340 [Streptomyces enissocaesilis]|uniref:Lactate utilization protein B C-terminal domain-containing protein n=2 Tax=Streptomyces enissocaesilis TaxID=332589 RepID=A0ABP6J9G1_9ACTN
MILGEVLAVLDVEFAVILPHLDERQRRLYLASEAEVLGHGRIAAVARLAEVSESAAVRGREELAAGAAPLRLASRTRKLHPRTLPGPGARQWTQSRDLPELPAESFRDWWKKNHS